MNESIKKLAYGCHQNSHVWVLMSYHLDGQFLRKLPKSSHNNTQHQYQVDLDYIETDDEGWTYAIAFPRLQYYLSRKKSHGKPKKTHCVRRRRWLRQAKPAAMVPVSEAETI